MNSRYFLTEQKELDLFIEKVERLKAEGLTYGDIAARFGVSRNCVVTRVKRHRERKICR